MRGLPPHTVGVAIWVPEEDGRPPALGHGVWHAVCLKPLRQRIDALHAEGGVPVPATVIRSALCRVRVGQLHQMNHAAAHPQPRAVVREAIVGAVVVSREAEDALVEVQGRLGARNVAGASSEDRG